MNHPLASWTTECGKAHGPNWTEWLGHLKDKPGACGLELGTFEGDSAHWFLENIFTHPTSEYTCIDTFEGSEEHHLAGIDCSQIEAATRAKLAVFGPRVHIEKGYSNEVMKIYRRPYFDMAYIDAAHDAMNVLRDSVIAFDLLKVGGVMIWDDYQWGIFPDAMDCPKLGVDSFINCFGRQLEIIGMGYQVAAKRVA